MESSGSWITLGDLSQSISSLPLSEAVFFLCGLQLSDEEIFLRLHPLFPEITPNSLGPLIQHVKQSPGYEASKALALGFLKRNWQLNLHQTLFNTTYVADQVERRDSVSADTFYEYYYGMNRPVVFKNPEVDLFPFAGMTPQYLKETLGDASIQFQNHRTQEKNYEIKSVQLKTTATLSEFIQKLEDEPESNDFYLTSNNMGHHLSVFKPLWTQRPLFPDFLDPTLIEKDRAVPSFWFGPKGTMTQMHQDITNSFYVQVVGSKKFYLISPFQTPYMYHHQNFFSPLDVENLDLLSYPLATKLKVIECTVNAGEILFIPLGWWHQVRSLEISIAMSFTNFRRINYFEPFSTVHGHKERQVNLAFMQLLRE